MPNKQHYYTPDAIDCNTCVSALASDFGVGVEILTSYERDMVQVVARTRRIAEGPQGVVQVQSLVRAPLKAKRDLYAMQYSALLDCWHQHDRGTLGVATAPVYRDWSGRPKQPERTNVG